MTKSQHDAIIAAIHNHRNVIAAGGTASGKTTLLNAILAEISTLGERIITIEDTKELKCTAENSVALTTMDKCRYGCAAKKDLATIAESYRCRRGAKQRSLDTD